MRTRHSRTYGSDGNVPPRQFSNNNTPRMREEEDTVSREVSGSVSHNGVLTERHTDHDNDPTLDSSLTSISYKDQRPSLGKGAVGRGEDRRCPPHGGVLAVDHSNTDNSNNSDDQASLISNSASRRNRIFYADEEGFSHIRSRWNGATNARATDNSSSINRNITINQNCFSVLGNSNEIQDNDISIDRAYASIMREVLNGMDNETRHCLKERARRVANVVSNADTSSTTQSQSATVVLTTEYTPTVTLPSDTLRSWRNNISRESSVAYGITWEHHTHPAV